MDRHSTSSPVFDDYDGANNYNTKPPYFGLQRAMQGIENIATDICQAKARKRDYIDNLFDYHNKHMEEL